MNTQEVLDKIKKPLRLGKSPNRHEAELAVQRAFELASKHQIDIENISLEDDVRKIVAEKFPCEGRISFARKKILNIVVRFFNVNIVLNRVSAWERELTSRTPTATFIGKPVDIQIARHVYDFLHTACAASLREFRKAQRRKPSRSAQENFIQGFVYGVASKLREAQGQLSEQQNAIVLSETGRRDVFEATLFDSTKPVKADVSRRNSAATMAGFIQGQKVEIRKPIESNAAGQLLLS